MTTSKLINSAAAGELLGISSAYLVKWFKDLKDFPQGTKTPKRAYMFDRKAVIDWAKTHNIKTEMIAAKKRRAGINSPERFNKTAALFLSGRCETEAGVKSVLPPARQIQLDFKKLAARTTKPKTTRIRLVPDWTLEDGPNAKNRRSAA